MPWKRNESHANKDQPQFNATRTFSTFISTAVTMAVAEVHASGAMRTVASQAI